MSGTYPIPDAAAVTAIIGGLSGYYQTVKTAGTPVVQRQVLNFVGATVADNVGTGATDVTIASTTLNGATVPAAGALTTGNVLQVTGPGALSYAALNLAGGTNVVTGVLPLANTAAQSPAAPAKLASCLHRWLCNDVAGSGTIVDDGTASNASLTVQNAGNVIQGNPGIYCDSIDFFGSGGATGGWAKSAANVGAPSSTTAISLHGWVRMHSFSNAYQHFVGRGYDTTVGADDAIAFYLSATTGQLITRWKSAGITKSGGAIATVRGTILTQQWYYLAATFSQSSGNMTVNYYINGVLIGTSVTASGVIDWNGASSGVWSMGVYNSGLWTAGTFDGQLCDWRVEDGHVLTVAEIKAHYKVGLGLVY